ncbi:conserved hypothetical protein [Pediculus humanus corporis]|uniref:Gamma-interferon-inducible lysosomal thiol reductase n=1 Tax=Pediculus humanus subsp. corporis TaxID=121224 RepID=E0VA92_PEDHC|nr:uncharacterized protein Phum_PHUM032320 [Pediculus humanus corporis]EEB10298.1 conserved hypothetical protein [Pediculus humanus corporis]
MRFFRNQLSSAYKNDEIREKVFFDLVPFGHGRVQENPFVVKCQHGPKECLGNVLHACFYSRHDNNEKQVNFGVCTMSTNNPPTAGQECAKKLNYSYDGVENCASGTEGEKYQLLNGKKTLDFKPKIKFIPTIVFNNVYVEADQNESLKNFEKLVLNKLKNL